MARQRRSRAIPWLAATLLVALLWAGAAPAQDAPGQSLPTGVVAIIDYQKLLRESAAARSIRQQVERRRDLYERELAAERERLESADRTLNEARAELDQEAYRERRREFEADVAGVQRLVQQRRRELDSASGAAFQEIRDTVVEIIDDLSDVYRFNVVLPRSDVLVFAPELDLTPEVMRELDARLPEVAIPAFEE